MWASVVGKSVVITGATKGIGKGIARVFAQQGAKVAVIGRVLEQAEACAEEFRSNGWYAQAFYADVKNCRSLEQMAKEVNRSFGGIDVLCANAGVFPSMTIEEMSSEQWDHVMNTNAKGTFFSLQACLPF